LNKSEDFVFSNDGKQLYTLNSKGKVIEWRLETQVKVPAKLPAPAETKRSVTSLLLAKFSEKPILDKTDVEAIMILLSQDTTLHSMETALELLTQSPSQVITDTLMNFLFHCNNYYTEREILVLAAVSQRLKRFPAEARGQPTGENEEDKLTHLNRTLIAILKIQPSILETPQAQMIIDFVIAQGGVAPLVHSMISALILATDTDRNTYCDIALQALRALPDSLVDVPLLLQLRSRELKEDVMDFVQHIQEIT